MFLRGREWFVFRNGAETSLDRCALHRKLLQEQTPARPVSGNRALCVGSPRPAMAVPWPYVFPSINQRQLVPLAAPVGASPIRLIRPGSNQCVGSSTSIHRPGMSLVSLVGWLANQYQYTASADGCNKSPPGAPSSSFSIRLRRDRNPPSAPLPSCDRSHHSFS